MKTIKVGLLGYGLSGRIFQAPFVHCHRGFELSKIMSSRTAEINEKYPDVKVVQHEDDILLDETIGLIIISTPNTTHYPLAKKALLNNKHVIVEKPFVTKISDGENLMALAEKKGKILTVFQNRRWDGDFLTIRKIIGSGRLGRIVEFETHFDRFRPQLDNTNWRNYSEPGAGVLFDLGPHLIDQALVLFGKPEYLYADIRIARDEGVVDDTFEIIFYYDKLRVKLKAGILVKEQGPHFIIHGTHGSFIKYGLDTQADALANGLMPDSKNWGADDPKNFGILNILENGIEKREAVSSEHGNYMGYFENIYQAITGNQQPDVHPDFALDNIRIIQAAFESSKTKKIIQNRLRN